MRKMALLIGILSGLVIAEGCSVGRKGSTNSRDFVCRNAPLKPGDPSVGWRKTRAPQATDGASLPRRFDSYRIPQAELDSFFSHAGKTETPLSFALPLPGDRGCQFFNVTSSGVIPKALAAKTPGLTSLKGTAVYNPNAEIRLDYDGSTMSAQVIWNDAVYLVRAVQEGSDVIYIIFNKEDSKEQKENFEENMNAAPSKKVAPSQIQQAPLPVQ
jgi:hypothetical protein